MGVKGAYNEAGAADQQQQQDFRMRENQSVHTPPSHYDSQSPDYAKRGRLYSPAGGYSSTLGASIAESYAAASPLDTRSRESRGEYAGMPRMPAAISRASPQPVATRRHDDATPAAGGEAPTAEKERRLSNSTSSIFASSTIANPDADQIMLCMSAVLQIQMVHDLETAPELARQYAFLNEPDPVEAAAAEAAAAAAAQAAWDAHAAAASRAVASQAISPSSVMTLNGQQSAAIVGAPAAAEPLNNGFSGWGGSSSGGMAAYPPSSANGASRLIISSCSDGVADNWATGPATGIFDQQMHANLAADTTAPAAAGWQQAQQPWQQEKQMLLQQHLQQQQQFANGAAACGGVWQQLPWPRGPAVVDLTSERVPSIATASTDWMTEAGDLPPQPPDIRLLRSATVGPWGVATIGQPTPMYAPPQSLFGNGTGAGGSGSGSGGCAPPSLSSLLGVDAYDPRTSILLSSGGGGGRGDPSTISPLRAGGGSAYSDSAGSSPGMVADDPPVLGHVGPEDPSADSLVEGSAVPSIDDIYAFIHSIFRAARFSPECNIIALVYINRVIARTQLPLHRRNWRPVVLASLILAQKVWDDKCLATSSFNKICPEYSKEQVRFYEMRLLELLEYQAIVTQSLYARYYFELRELFEHLVREQGQQVEQDNFPLQPLSLWRARQLEIYSDSFRLQPSRSGSSADGVVASTGGSVGTPMSMRMTSSSLGGGSAYSVAAGTRSAGGSVGRSVGSYSGVPSLTRNGSGEGKSDGLRSPAAPSSTYEDVTYTPRGRYVQS